LISILACRFGGFALNFLSRECTAPQKGTRKKKKKRGKKKRERKQKTKEKDGTEVEENKKYFAQRKTIERKDQNMIEKFRSK
jgi:hypothetical protein